LQGLALPLKFEGIQVMNKFLLTCVAMLTTLLAHQATAQTSATGQLTIVTPQVLSACNSDTIEVQLINLDGPVCPTPGFGGGLCTVTVNIPGDSLISYVAGSLSSNVVGGANFVSYVNKALTFTMPVPTFGSTTIAKFVIKPDCRIIDADELPVFTGSITYPVGYPTPTETFESPAMNTGSAILDNPASQAAVDNVVPFGQQFASVTRPINVGYGNLNTVEYGVIVDTAMPSFNYLYFYSANGLNAQGLTVPANTYHGYVLPTTAVKTQYDPTHWLYKFTVSGANLGPDNALSPGEQMYLAAYFTPPSSCTTLTQKYYMSYSCPGVSSAPCAIPDTLSGLIRIAAGTPILSGINYQIDSFDGCPNKAGQFYFKNTASGVHPIGTAYDVNLNLSFGNEIIISNLTFAGVNPATIPLQAVNNGSSIAFKIKNVLTVDPDGPGGLSDLDFDGFFDDLKTGDSIKVTFDYTVPCNFKCGTNLLYDIASSASFTDYCGALNGSTGTSMYKFGFSQKQGVTQRNIPNYGNLFSGGVNYQTRGAGFTFQFQETNMNLATTVAKLRISYNNFAEIDTSQFFFLGSKVPGSAFVYEGINIPGDSTNSNDSAMVLTLSAAQVALLFDATSDSLYYAETLYNCERRQFQSSLDYWQILVRTKPGLCSNGSTPCTFDISCKKSFLYNANFGCGNKPCFVINDSLWREKLIGHTSVAQTTPLLGDERRMYEGDTVVYNHKAYLSGDWALESPLGTYKDFQGLRQSFSLNYPKPVGYYGYNPLVFLEDISRLAVYARDSVTGAVGAKLYDVPLKLKHFVSYNQYYGLNGGANVADTTATFWYGNACPTCTPIPWCSYVSWAVDPGNCPINDTFIYRGSPYWAQFQNIDNDKATQHYYLDLETALKDQGLLFKMFNDNLLYDVQTRWRINPKFPWSNFTDFSFGSIFGRAADNNYTITGEGVSSCGYAATAGFVAPKRLTIANPNSAYNTLCGLTVTHQLNFDSYAGDFFTLNEVRVPFKIDSFVVDLPSQFALTPGTYNYQYSQSCAMNTTTNVAASSTTGHIKFTNSLGGDFPRIDDCAGFQISNILSYNIAKVGFAAPSTYKFPVKVYARTEWGAPFILNDSASITEANPNLTLTPVQTIKAVEDGGKCTGIAMDFVVANNTIFDAPFVYFAAENSLGGATIVTINDGDSVYADPIIPGDVTVYGAKHKIAKVGTINAGKSRIVRVIFSSSSCLDSFKVYVDYGCAYPSPMQPNKASATIDSAWAKYKSVRPAISSTSVGDVNVKTLCGTDTVEIEVRNVRSVNVYDMIASFRLPANTHYVPGTAYAKGDTRILGLNATYVPIPAANDSVYNGDSLVLDLRAVAPFNTTCGLVGSDTLANATVRIRFEISYDACPTLSVDPVLYVVSAANYCGTIAKTKGAVNLRYVGAIGTPNTYSCTELASKPVYICAKVNQTQFIRDTLFVQNLGGYGGLSGPSSGYDSLIITVPTDSTLFAIADFETGGIWGTPIYGYDSKGNLTLRLQVPAGLAVGDSIPLPLSYYVTPKVEKLCTLPQTICPNLSFFTTFVSEVYLSCLDSGLACISLRKEIRGRGLQLRDFICCGSISNFVWIDSNKDGSQGFNEPGVAGVTVDLYQNGPDGLAGTADDYLVGSTMTDATGQYKFDELLPSLDNTLNYNVGVTMPTGYVVTTPFNRGDNNVNINSDGDTTLGIQYGRSTSISLQAAENDSSVDFGIYYPTQPTATVGNYVWLDSNKNGIQDPSEQGISGAVVTLKNAAGQTVAVTTTDENGYYSFTNVAPATGYKISVSPIVGYVPSVNTGAITLPGNSDLVVTTLTTAAFNVAPGDNITYIDAGFAPQLSNRASLGDRVWYDDNQNGVQDAGEAGVPGVTVKLLNGPGTSTLQTAVTDAFGNYTFNNLAASSYRVEFDLSSKPGYTLTAQNATTNTNFDSNPSTATGRTNVIYLGAGEVNMSIDAGIYNPANTNSIGDLVWNDTDKDGIQDAGEPGVSGVTVTLLNAAGVPVAVTTTNAQGAYEFPGLPNGTYSVSFSNLQPGMVFTAQETAPSATGSDANPLTGKSGPIVLSGNTNNNDIDAGIYQAGTERFTASLGNYVWYDLNNNGIQDVNETGVSGVTATLVDAGLDGIAGNSDDGASRTTLTNGLGEYMFTGLKPSNYLVRFSDLPVGYTISPANAGTNDAKDSDPAALISGIASSPIYMVTEGTENLTVDLGIYKPGVNTLGNYVWFDANGDGVQNAATGEPPVPGVQVTLLDSLGLVWDSNPAIPGTQPQVTTTDANGKYLFTDLPNGWYSVGFSNLPEGLEFAPQGTGTATDSDPDTSNGVTKPVQLTGGTTNMDLDAGLITNGKAVLGNLVWDDVNGDGIQDPTEAGVPGILVTLYDAAGIPVGNAVTDANGAYLFTNLDPGTYTVGFKNIPEDKSFTKQNATGDAADSDADPLTGITAPITLAANDINLSVDAGLFTEPKGGLGNYVWYDQNKDGLQSANEPGVGGVTVKLLDAVTGALVSTAITDGSGFYSFTNLDTGSNKYVVSFAPPAGYKFTTPGTVLNVADNSDVNQLTGKTSPVSVVANAFNPNIDAGLTISDTLGNYVWVDANSNGIQDAGEAGVAGVTVTLYDNITGKVKASTITDAYGFYEFTDIGKGQYFLQYSVPPGYTFTGNLDPFGTFILQTPNNSDISTATGTTKPFLFETGQVNRNADVGLVPIDAPTANLGDYVWLDANKDGLQDTTEQGIAGVTVTLLDAGGNTVATTITDENGKYLFKDLDPGSYQVRFTSPVGLVPTVSVGGVNSATNSDMDQSNNTTPFFSIIAGTDQLNVDAGFAPQAPLAASLGDKVWYDTDNDGVQDATEAGVANIVVNLLDGTGGFLGTTTTDALGNYIFNGLAAGNYRVEFVLPGGYQVSPQSGTTDTTKDSNPATSGITPIIALAAGATNMTVDAGIYNPTNNNSIGDYVWKDQDKDGLQDATESGVAGIAVTLLDASGVPVATTVTDADGKYQFTGLPNGTYNVLFSNLPDDLAFTTQTANTPNGSDANAGGITPGITVTGGQHITDIDAGLISSPNLPSVASLGDKVWWDLNSNGLQDPTELGVGGVKVYLYDAAGTTLLDSTYTSALGEYMFLNLTPATYVVGFALNTLPAGATVTSKNADGAGVGGATNSDANTITGKTDPIAVPDGAEIRIADMGIIPAPNRSTVGDFVWFDLDKDGLQDANEPGAQGVNVTLYNEQGAAVASTTTDENGKYIFANVTPGNYTVLFNSLPAGFVLTTKTPGTADGSDADSTTGRTAMFTVPANSNITNIDAGIKTTTRASLGDYVWHDLNSNGVQDASEPAVGGIVVKLYDGGGNEVAETTTDLDGFYLFSNLNPGSYQVGFTNAFAPLTFTAKESAVTVEDGSNVNPATGLSDFIALTAGQFNPTVDAGIIANGSGSVGDYVWFDVNGNGVQDGTEAPAPGVTVTLYDSTGAPIGVAITDGNGKYLFNDVVPSNGYTVGFSDLPSGYGFADRFGAITGTTNSDAGTNGQSLPFSVAAGEAVRYVDAGLVIRDTLGNYVWNDLNKDGIQDTNEPGVAGVAVTLYNAANGAIVATVLTDAYGKYEFADIPAGTYQVGFTPPSNYVFTQNTDLLGTNQLTTVLNSDADSASGKTKSFMFEAGMVNRNVDAGIFYKAPISASVGNFVWEDQNANGLQDAGEPGIAGVVVTLFNTAGDPVASTITDGNGSYIFKDVLPGTYSVGFTSPVDFVPTTAAGVLADPNNSDLVASTGQTLPFTVVAGENNLNVDAGFVLQNANLASLGNKVWFDVNQNGVQDPSEDGVSDVTVQLYNGAGTTLIAATETNVLGEYVFNNLAAGSYSVKFVTPSGYTITPQAGTADSALDSNPVPGTGFTAPIALAAGQRNMTIDAGIFNPNANNSIGDFVWADDNSNGLQDATESGLSGVTVTLYNSTGAIVTTTTTDKDGKYLFTGVPNGTYSVGFSNFPPGKVLSNQTVGTATGSDADPATGKTPTVTLVGGTHLTDLDAGLKPSNVPDGTASLGDKVWWDVNNNGLQDATESGVANVKVFLYDAAGTTKLDSTITNALGNYIFTGLPAGTYVVGFDLTTKPAGTTVSTQNIDGLGIGGAANSDGNTTTGKTGAIVLGTGEEKLTIDLGIVPALNTASVGDKVWYDTDKDGIQDATEPGVPGVQVSLLNAAGNVIAVTTTDANGNYAFPNLPAGTYSIEFANLPAGLTFATQTTGTPNGSDADTVTGKTPSFTLTAGQVKTDMDAGVVSTTKAALGNYVWFDADSDGIQDATEAGIPGVLVTLVDKVGNKLASTVTDGTGKYMFTNLNPGQYLVEFTNFAQGTVFTMQEAAPSATGSDVNPISGRTALITLAAGAVNLDIDAGIKPGIIGSLGDYVWFDTDKDGLQDATEQGVAGVVAKLLNATGVVLAEAVTDGNGYYHFGNLPPATYAVNFSNFPSGNTLTVKSGATLDPLNSDADTVTKTTAPVALASGQHIPTVDAGLVKNTINLYGNVWHDINGMTDGFVNNSGAVQVPPASPIPVGIRAYLVDAATNAIIKQTFVSSANGTYQFLNIEPGKQYRVLVTSTLMALNSQAPSTSVKLALPTGWSNTGDKIGLSAGNDGVVNGRINIPSALTTNDIYNVNFGIRRASGEAIVP
jgi:protocatechuate 3,4-dioxygenase beta subunit